jgi:hypothetical protein
LDLSSGPPTDPTYLEIKTTRIAIWRRKKDSLFGVWMMNAEGARRFIEEQGTCEDLSWEQEGGGVDFLGGRARHTLSSRKKQTRQNFFLGMFHSESLAWRRSVSGSKRVSKPATLPELVSENIRVVL